MNNPLAALMIKNGFTIAQAYKHLVAIDAPVAQIAEVIEIMEQQKGA